MHRIHAFIERNKALFTALALLTIVIAIVLRNSGIYPFVFADEYFYNKFSRLTPLSDAILPNYLYFKIYHLTNTCGDSFLQCSRFFNALFFVAAAPFIYLSAKRVANTPTAGLVTALALASAMNSFTAYFMPESAYFFFAWLTLWQLLGLTPQSRLYGWIVAGASLAATSLIKPHALFIVPTVIIYAGWLAKTSDGPRIRQFVVTALSFTGSVVLTKFAMGYVLAGSAGLSLFGTFYGGVANGATSLLDHLLELGRLGLENGSGHAMVVVTLFAMPCAACLLTVPQQMFAKTSGDAGQRVTFFTAFIVLNLIGVVALFTASIGIHDLTENARLHLRYYDFTFPLLLIVGASQVGKERARGVLSRGLAAIAITIVLAASAISRMRRYRPGYVDGPEIYGFLEHRTLFYALVLLGLVSLVTWIWSRRAGALAFLCLTAPFGTLVGTWYVNAELAQLHSSSVFDRAGLFARQHLQESEQGSVVIIADSAAGAFRTLFYLDNGKASYLTLPQETRYERKDLPVGTSWVLEVGTYISPVNAHITSQDGFKLVKLVD